MLASLIPTLLDLDSFHNHHKHATLKAGKKINYMHVWYTPLFLKLRIIAAMANPSKTIKRMATKPPTTPPTMAAIRFGILPERV